MHLHEKGFIRLKRRFGCPQGSTGSSSLFTTSPKSLFHPELRASGNREEEPVLALEILNLRFRRMNPKKALQDRLARVSYLSNDVFVTF